VVAGKKPPGLSLKPDMEEAARRWDAFYAGEIIDRPVVCVTAPREGVASVPPRLTYREKAFGDVDEVIFRELARAEATFCGGEEVPAFFPSLAVDEVAAYVGAEIQWHPDSPDTNWAVPFVENWEEVLPLRLREDNPLWQRVMTLYERASELLAGKMLIAPLDFHTNMDLLAAIRGPERLCTDLLDQPDVVEEAMKSARAIFPQLWDHVTRAGKMHERGFWQYIFSMEGAALLCCDFIAMISPAMFRRFVLPALEEEASIVKHVFFHWDGPRALVHEADILACEALYLLEYVPGAGEGRYIDHVDLFKRWQAAGKAVWVSGTPDEAKAMHRELRPEKVIYSVQAESQAEAEELLRWFVRNT